MLVQHFLEQTAARLPEKTALVFGGRRWSYAELDARANQLARALTLDGLGAGGRAVIQLENSPETLIAIFAVLKAGGVFVPVNPQVKPAKLAFVVRDCEASVLITGGGHDAGDGAGARVITLQEGTWAYGDRDAAPLPPSAGERDLAALIYTSGSTGVQRGVMLSHRNMAAASSSIIEYLGNVESDVILNLLPLSFDYGLYNALMPIRFGGTVVLERGFVAPHQIVRLLQSEGVTGLPLLPTLIAGLVKLRSLEGLEFPSLRYITSSGQALPPAHLSRLRQLFPSARVFSMYGLTECKRVAYLPPEELDRRPTSVGKAMPRTEAWIVDEAGQRIEKAGEVGELVVRGDHVMQGYWNRPEETERALRTAADGTTLLHTGDLFRMDEEGFLYFVARRDDLIKTSGFRVSPREIETAICEMEGVVEAVAVGVPDEILGQAVRGVVTVHDGSAITPEAVIAHCERLLQAYMVPRRVEIRSELPLTVTGKISRRTLAAEES